MTVDLTPAFSDYLAGIAVPSRAILTLASSRLTAWSLAWKAVS